MADEIAHLVLNGASEDSVKGVLLRNYPSGVTIANIDEMLQLVYVDPDKENLKKAIDFVQIFDSNLQAQAYKSLYKYISFKQHTGEPEILLLQKKIRPMVVIEETRNQVDADCRAIIKRIAKGIEDQDFSISRYLEESIDGALLNDNMASIVGEVFTGTLDNVLQLIDYSRLGLLNVGNRCFLMDAVLKNLEDGNMLDSEQAMHLWAHAKFTKEESKNWSKMEASSQKLCTDAIAKLSELKHRLYRHYQNYIEDKDTNTFYDLHTRNWDLKSIVCDFVSFYYNGDVARTRKLLDAAHVVLNYVAVGRFLSQLYEEMDKMKQLSSFEAFRLFNQVRRQMESNNYKYQPAEAKKPFVQLKGKCPKSVSQLLWPENINNTEFQIVNKFSNSSLGVDKSNVVCLTSGDNQTWKIYVDSESSLLNLTHPQNYLELGMGNNPSATCLSQKGTKWMVKPVDENTLQIYSGNTGLEMFLTGDEYNNVQLVKVNSTEMQLWKLQLRQL